MADSDPSRHVAELGRLVEDGLSGVVTGKHPANLYDPIRYVLAGGGKRFRPLLTLLSAEAFGVAPERALPAALAVEVFHNFTLVHDDIMDQAAERRGRPAVHVKWDPGDAILAGDRMLGLSYELLQKVEQVDARPLFETFHHMVRRLCEGQAFDKAFETRSDVTLQEYMVMIEGKTAALLEACLVLGGLIGGADPGQLKSLEALGRTLGLAFQIQDDLLDLTAQDPGWGKRIGGDLIVGKKTYLLLTTLETADAPNRAWFERILIQGGLDETEIDEARSRMSDLGVLDAARRALDDLYQEAQNALLRVPPGQPRQTLGWVIDRLSLRAK